jgi:hypothetical protein
MTPLLEQAWAAVQSLPEPDQDTIASLIMDEIADEQQWDEQFSRSQPQLKRWADKVRSDIQSGRVRRGGIDEL